MSAILKIYDILLDIKRATTNNKIEVVEGDNGNVFRIFLTDNGEPVDIEGCRVVAVFSSGDGTAEQDTSDTPLGEHIFTWNGDEWVVDSFRTVDDLDLCGITLVGTPAVNDTVTINYYIDDADVVHLDASTSITGGTVTVEQNAFLRSLASVMIGGLGGNEIDILVRSGSYSSSGINECEIQVYSGDKDDVLITTAKFNFQSRRSSMNDETLRSEEKFPLLVTLIARVNEALQKALPYDNVTASLTELPVGSLPTASVNPTTAHFSFGFPKANGIVSVTKSGTGAAGTKDTYTITFDNNTTFSFEVYNGTDGSGAVTSVNGQTGDVVLDGDDIRSTYYDDDPNYEGLTYTVDDILDEHGYALNSILGTEINGNEIGDGDITLTASDVGAVPTTRTVNSKALSTDISLTASDVGAAEVIKVSNPTVGSDWTTGKHGSDADNTYPERLAIPVTGVTSTMFAEVVFGVTDAASGVYSPVCDCGAGVVYIWAKTQTAPTVLSILVHK